MFDRLVCTDKLQLSRKEVAHLSDVMSDLQTQCARHEDTAARTAATVNSLEQELRSSKAREDDLEEQIEATLSEVRQYIRDVETLEQEKKSKKFCVNC